MAENYNIDPYYDDFDPNKNFHRILFKPGYAVQARELTQSQTILQNQISQFASAIYSQNTPVSGGQVTTNLNCYYLKLNPTYNNLSISASSFIGQKITNDTGSIIAQVVSAAEATGNALVAGDPPTLIVTYLSGGRFVDTQTLYITDGVVNTPVATLIGVTTGQTTCTGLSSVASVSSGVFWVINGYNTVTNADGTTSQYQIGNFVNLLPQTVILDKYDNIPSLRVGLNIVESTVTYVDDASLLDPAPGATNYLAPGADRYQVTLNLETRPLTIGNDDNFIELLRINNGQIVKQSTTTTYSALDDYIAKRDYETNGDYVVEDFKLTPTPNAAGNSAYYDMIISKGVAYVHGYRVENQSNITLTSPRAQNTAVVQPGNNNVFVSYGSYYTVDTSNGTFDITTMPTIDLHCVSQANIVSTNTTTYSSTLIGTGYIRGLQYLYTTGTNNYVYQAYVNDITTTSLSSNVNTALTTSNTIQFFDITGKLSSIANAYYGATLAITGGTDTGDVRIINSWNPTTKTATVNQPFTVTPDGTSNVSIIFSTGNAGSIVQKNPTLFGLTAGVNINVLSGRVNGVNAGAAILWNASTPEMIFQLPNSYIANGSMNSVSFTSTMIWRNVTWSGVTNATTPITTPSGVSFQGTGSSIFGETFRQNYTVIDTVTGKILDFNTSANCASVNTSTSAIFQSAAYTAANRPVNIIADVVVSVPALDYSGIIVKTKTLITGNTGYVGTFSTAVPGANTNTFLDLNTGQAYILGNTASNTAGAISLYVADVKNITKIYDTGARGTSLTTGTSLTNYRDITTSFSFDNGQRDNFYDFASIKLLPGVAPPKGNILVVFNYYAPSGGDAFFNGTSYLPNGTTEKYAQIPSYTSKRGTLYNLRDCIDFRPVRQNNTNANTYTWVYKTAPASTAGNSGGMFLPVNNGNFTSGYQYYLARKDKLVLTKDSNFLMILGTPSVNAISPTEPDGSLVLANISLDPYTAYVPGEGPNYSTGESSYGTTTRTVPVNLSVNKVIHKRWAKSDISDLQTQVDNLEYYTSLSLLESNANALQVPDVNGLNRFKNGILVDDFSTYATSDTTSFNNYKANINIRTKTMSPLTHINNFQLQNPLVLGTLGTLPKTTSYAISTLNGTQTNIYTLPYTTANLITQPLASNTVSVNPFNVVLYEGICTLNPPMDNWVNNIEAPNVIITEPQFQFTQQTGGINLTNAGDYQSLPGTTVAPATGSATTTNQAYASQASGLNQATGTSSAAATPLSATNGYVTNNGVLPYIRPQEVIIRAKGLLVNAPLACWFDGINVDKYMIQPNTIELYNVKGRFEEDDIVGFYDNVTTRQFFPIGRVVSTYNYGANTATSKNGLSNTRLYISSYIQTPNTVATVNLINAYFSSNGQYQYSTANGQVKFTNANSIITLHTNGNVAAAGNGKFTSTTQNVVAGLYKTIFISGASTFFNQYAAWGDQNNGTTWNAYFPVSVVANANYTITTSSTSAGSTNFGYTYNGLYYYTAVVTGGYNTGNPVSTTITTIPGATSIGAFGALRWDAANTANAFLSWNQTNPSNTTAGIAVTVRDSNNNLIWNTMSPNGLTMANVATKFTMVGGGSMFTGCKQIVLDKNASSANQFYQGSAITVKTTLIYPHNYTAEYIPPTPQLYVVVGSVSNGDGDTSWPVYDWVDDTAGIKARAEKIANEQAQVVWLSSTYTFSANVIDYYGPTRVATLDAPVDIAIGTNQQYGQITSQYSLNGVVASVKDAMYYGNTIPKLSSDERGNFAAVFNIPGSQFYTGQRVFRVDNRNRASNDPKSATTYAESTFWAGGVQDSTNSFSPSVDSSARNFTPQNSQGYNIVSQTSPIDPVAQTFLVDKQNYPNGVFLSSLKLFFAPYQNSLKAPTAPVIVSLMGTLNGYPNGKTLDHSIVVKSGEDIKVSNAPHYLDPDTYTEFVFDAPVYVQSGVLYAFVVHSNSVDYSLYYGGQNQIAITSTSTALPIGKGGVAPTKPSKIGAAPYVGALFESQNSITWTADQTKDLMFVMNQCKFDITQNPTIPFSTTYQLRSRKLGRQDVLQKVDANLVSSIYMSQGTDQSMHAFNVSTTDFVPSSTGLTYSYSSTLQVGQSVTTPQSITPGRFGTPAQDNFYLNDGKGARTLLTGSNTSFQLFAQLSSSDANVSPILSDDGIALYSILYSVDNLGIPTKAVSVANTGAGYSNNATIVITSALGKSNSLNDYLTNDLPVFGYTTNSFTGAISSIYTTYQGSGYVATPTITILDPTTRSGNALINASPFSTSVNGIGTTNFLGQLQVGATLTTQNNIVIGTIQSITNSNNLILTTNALSWSNANTYFCSNATFVVSGETSPTGGNAQHRYYTKKVILTPGNDSGDLRVYCTAYKPAGSQIYVYYRILNAADTGKLEDQNWQIMTQKGGAGVFSTARSNLIEYEYAPGNFYGTSPNNSISYTSTTTGSTYNKFIQFAIKVIIVTSDKTAVPFLSDIRALALPSGTGT